MAYKLRRHWHDLEITVEEDIEELRSIHAIEVHYPQMSYQQIPEPRSVAILLLEKARITLPEAIPFKGACALTRKKLVSERKKLTSRTLSAREKRKKMGLFPITYTKSEKDLDQKFSIFFT